MLKWSVLDDHLIDKIARLDRQSQAEWLILKESKEFHGFWQVDALWPDYFLDLESLVGRFRLVSPSRVDEFLVQAKERGYHVAFDEDPAGILASFEGWDEPPPFELNSSLDNTVNGFLPWQVVGFNRLIKKEQQLGLVIWDTGTGKTAFIASAIRWHMLINPFDLAVVVVKTHNKIDTQRKLMSLGGITSVVIDGPASKRARLYTIAHLAQISGPTVMILNYEKFRDDNAMLKPLLTGKRCLFFWDEAPTKLSNRSTKLYQRLRGCLYRREQQDNGLYKTFTRPAWVRHWVLTATPVENSPEDVFNYVHLFEPGLLGSVTDFHNTYVSHYNWISEKPDGWKNLDKLEAKLQFITHRVSLDDPAVAKMFPEAIPLPTVIDWHAPHREVYDQLTGKAKIIVEDFEDANILALIQTMQMMCDAPSMVIASANKRQEYISTEDWGEDNPLPKGSAVALQLFAGLNPKQFEDAHHTKLTTWKEIITEKHPNDKIVTHSTWASYIFPVWEQYLTEWDISYVVYTGTSKQKQAALDAFREDPSIRVFLSGDSGADSIDIPQARVGVNYNGPWKSTTEKQREGRRNRVDSDFQTTYTYTLTMADSVEDRKREIRERKQGYHDALFEGKAVEMAESGRLTRKDLLYMLTGDLHD